jgi:hypothetical protein
LIQKHTLFFLFLSYLSHNETMQKNDMKHTLLHTFLLSALGMAATTVQAATVITDAEMTQYTAPAN